MILNSACASSLCGIRPGQWHHHCPRRAPGWSFRLCQICNCGSVTAPERHVASLHRFCGKAAETTNNLNNALGKRSNSQMIPSQHNDSKRSIEHPLQFVVAWKTADAHPVVVDLGVAHRFGFIQVSGLGFRQQKFSHAYHV